MLINTVIMSNVGTTSGDVGSSCSSSTWQITRKSMFVISPPNTQFWWSLKATLATIWSMGVYLCPQCLVTKSQVPNIGKDFDLWRQQPLQNYVKDAAAHVEDSCRIIFDLGMSVGEELEIQKKGSLLLMRVMHFPLLSFCLGSCISECISHWTRCQPSQPHGGWPPSRLETWCWEKCHHA